jgi:ssDNA-binding replication factor A large subunit
MKEQQAAEVTNQETVMNDERTRIANERGDITDAQAMTMLDIALATLFTNYVNRMIETAPEKDKVRELRDKALTGEIRLTFWGRYDFATGPEVSVGYVPNNDISRIVRLFGTGQPSWSENIPTTIQ